MDMIFSVNKIILLTPNSFSLSPIIMILSVSVKFRKPNSIIQSSIEDHNCLLAKWRDWPVESEPLPRKCGLNLLLNINKKGSSKLYRKLKGSNEHILDNICESWKERSGPEFCNFSLSTSFSLHHAMYQNTYLKYIQFSTLHKRFYTNEKLYKMGIKESSICSMCTVSEDSVEHMLINCPISILCELIAFFAR